MQRGSLAMVSRKEAPSVWQLRWSEKNLHGVRVQRKRAIGSVEPGWADGRNRTGAKSGLNSVQKLVVWSQPRRSSDIYNCRADVTWD